MDLKTFGLLISFYLLSIIRQQVKTKSVSVWIVENEEHLTSTGLTSYKNFESNRVYIILVQIQGVPKRRTKMPETFCWVGAESPVEEAVQAVIDALTLLPQSHLTKGIRKEFQGRESRDFEAIFEPSMTETENLEELHEKHFSPKENDPFADTVMEENHPTKAILKEVEEQKIWMAETRMLLVKPRNVYDNPRWKKNKRMTNIRIRSRRMDYSSEEDDHDQPVKAALEEVEFSSKYLEYDNICLVAFNWKMVYLHCGKQVSAKYNLHRTLKNAAQFIADEMLKEMGPQTEIFQNPELYSSEENLELPPENNRLFEEFERISEAKSEYKDVEGGNSEPSAMCELENLTIRRLWKRLYESEVSDMAFERPFEFFQILRDYTCFIVNPGCEHLSTLVWMGKAADSDVRKECIRKAVILVKKQGFITYIDEKYTTLGRRRSRLAFSPEEFICTMQRIYPSWTDIFQNTDEDRVRF